MGAMNAAWDAHLRTKRNSRQARRSSFDAGWNAALEHAAQIAERPDVPDERELFQVQDWLDEVAVLVRHERTDARP